MELFNLLAENATKIELFGNTFDVSLNWIGNLIRGLITGVASVGVGVILFSLILKLIVLPFDIYQRVAMRKQNIKMEANKERMAKLQKQYANDKAMYNQKLMEMYKENGISMFSSCLPMILSLVIFIVAINAFNAYSQFSSVETYNMMVDAYNARLEQYCPELTDANVTELTGANATADHNNEILVKGDGANEYIYYYVNIVKDVDENGNVTLVDYKANNYEYVKKLGNDKKTFYIDNQKALTIEGVTEGNILSYFEYQARAAVKEAYKTDIKDHTQFLWIKNIWQTDASYKHPVLKYSDFKAEAKQEKFKTEDGKKSFSGVTPYTNAYTQKTYDKVTAELSAEKKDANGYYILIVLSIGTILLQQVVMMRSQKAQQQFSSVDGQGASQQKMMLVIMTVMFGIFSFMYSAAFSIYMTTSNLFSMGSTIVINKVVDKVMAKREAKALQEKYNKRFPGRASGKAENKKK